MNEFDKLIKLLDDAKIPYERNDDKDPNNTFFAYTGGHPMKRIVYGRDAVYSTKHDMICVCSAIWGYGSYGYEEGLIEIMGLLTPEEEEYDSVKGYLTADNVFNRIKKHWEETNNGREAM